MLEQLKRLFQRRTNIPVVQLSGMIGAGLPSQSQLSLEKVASALATAFAYRRAPAVAILINSPGGSPVQSHLIFRRIRQLAEEKKKPVIAFVEDVAASGGYMLACAGDEIVADPSSIVGSIGVVSHGFGFVGLIERIGVERRMHAAGAHKGMLDPFQPEVAEDVAHLKELQREIHEHFIALVRDRRGTRLADDPDLFSGLFWTGQKGVSLGLVDALGEVRSVLRERYGEDVRLRLLRPTRPGLLRRLMGGTIGLAVTETVALADERAIRSRYGL